LRENMATHSDPAQRGKLRKRRIHYLSFKTQGLTFREAPNSVVILSGAKDLSCFSRSRRRLSEMFRSAKHDTTKGIYIVGNLSLLQNLEFRI
jgi:hypothetical protein